MVERRADVVGHAAVDGDVLADAGQGFKDAHGVERDAGVGDKAATRLDENARLGHAVFSAEILHGTRRAFREVLDRGGLVGREVGHAQAAAQVELGDLDAVFLPDARDELDHDLRGFAERMQREDLRTDMAVEADELHVGGLDGVLHALEGEVVEHGEAELRVLATRTDVLVRVGLDAGRDAHVDGLLDAKFAGNLGHARELDAAVDHDAAYTCGDGFAQLGRRLVVAVHEDALHREARHLCAGELSTARHVEAEALLVHDAHDFLVQKRLRSVDDVGVLVARAERLAVGFHAPTKVGLVEHVERGAFLARELHHVNTADEQVVIANLGRAGKNLAQIHDGEVVGLLASIGCWERHSCPF